MCIFECAYINIFFTFVCVFECDIWCIHKFIQNTYLILINVICETCFVQGYMHIVQNVGLSLGKRKLNLGKKGSLVAGQT